jgi:hypothetical protein
MVPTSTDDLGGRHQRRRRAHRTSGTETRLGVTRDLSPLVVGERITQDGNTVRWQWSPGDVAMWDNCATPHRVIEDWGDQSRRLHWVTVAGQRPVGLDGRVSVTRSGSTADYLSEPVSDPYVGTRGFACWQFGLDQEVMSAAIADTTVSSAGGCRAHRRSPRVRKLARGLQPVADVGGRRHLRAGLHRADDPGRRR